LDRTPRRWPSARGRAAARDAPVEQYLADRGEPGPPEHRERAGVFQRGRRDQPTQPVLVAGQLAGAADALRTDNGLWALPGGAQDFGEYIAETAARETREEAGVEVEVTGVVGIYTNPNHVVEYSDGEVRQQFSICFRGHYVSGQPTTSDESSAVRWVAQDELDTLPIHPSMRLRIDHGFERWTEPYVG
jgi:ADP-ribose pyrophosphatase YjhB (NUDIX family)